MPPIRMIRLIMRAPLRFFAVPCCLFALSALATSLFAQQPAGKATLRPGQAPPATSKTGPPPKPGPVTQTAAQANIGAQAAEPPKQQRPEANPMVIEPVSAELKVILDEWEQKSSQIKSLHGNHTRFVYNHVFELEKRAKGVFYVETPDKGRIDLTGKPPVKIKGKDEVSKKTNKQTGRPYRIEADRDEMWICDGNEITIVNGEEKTYEKVPVPDHLRGTKIIDGPLPFLFGMKSADAQKRFQMKLLSNTPTSLTIQIEPRRQADANNYKMAEIILDKKTYLPIAVRMHDPNGNLETVYSFEILDVNNRSLKAKLASVFGDSDPFYPKLKGYKLVLPAQEEGVARPNAPGAKGTSNGATAPRSNSAGPPAKSGQPAPRQSNSTTQPRK